MDELNGKPAPPLDHQQRIVTETEDNPVVRKLDLEEQLAPIREEQGKQKLVMRIGFGVLGALTASPKLGGPTAQQAVSEAAQTLGAAGSVIAGLILSVLAFAVHLKTS